MENKKNFYIDGKWVASKSKQEINVINPATEENCAVISLGNKKDIDYQKFRKILTLLVCISFLISIGYWINPYSNPYL